MAEKYEPYEKPSAVPGIAVTGLGIGALAYLARKKIPGLNILAKVAKTTTTTASRNTDHASGGRQGY